VLEARLAGAWEEEEDEEEAKLVGVRLVAAEGWELLWELEVVLALPFP
jgi:hypothetical protein